MNQQTNKRKRKEFHTHIWHVSVESGVACILLKWCYKLTRPNYKHILWKHIVDRHRRSVFLSAFIVFLFSFAFSRFHMLYETFSTHIYIKCIRIRTACRRKFSQSNWNIILKLKKKKPNFIMYSFLGYILVFLFYVDGVWESEVTKWQRCQNGF